MKESGNSVRINRDDLREMCFDSVWTGKREGFIKKAQRAIAAAALEEGFNVVVDDTNLTEGHRQSWSQFAQQKESKFERESFTTPIPECISRDLVRAHGHVGAGVIYNLALRAGMLAFDNFVICDIDGTIADCSWRRARYLESTPKDWDGFFHSLHSDTPINSVIGWVNNLAQDFQIVLVSGRPDNYARTTIDWLERYSVPFQYLLMRRGGDKRPDDIVKREIADLLPIERCAMVLDDRPRLIRMWRELREEKHLTFPVIPVAGQCEEF